MAIAETGTLETRLLNRQSPLDPIWDIYLRHASTGDASGDDITVTSTLPADTGCILLYASLECGATGAHGIGVRIDDGLKRCFMRGLLNDSSSTADVTRQGAGVVGPRAVFGDVAQQTTLITTTQNRNAAAYQWSARLIGWPLADVQQLPERWFFMYYPAGAISS